MISPESEDLTLHRKFGKLIENNIQAMMERVGVLSSTESREWWKPAGETH
jgi:hypothetical protein